METYANINGNTVDKAKQSESELLDKFSCNFFQYSSGTVCQHCLRTLKVLLWMSAASKITILCILNCVNFDIFHRLNKKNKISIFFEVKLNT